MEGKGLFSRAKAQPVEPLGSEDENEAGRNSRKTRDERKMSLTCRALPVPVPFLEYEQFAIFKV